MPRQAELGIDSNRTHVVAGILRNASCQVLITDRQRSASMRDFWEFPGGKVEPGESASSALRRELEEELGIESLQAEHFRRIEHDYPDLHVTIDFFIVSAWQGAPGGREGQQLRWVDTNDLGAERLLPADAPLIEALRDAPEFSKC